MWWIIEVRDDAILGCSSGVQSERTVSEGIETKEQATKEKQGWSSCGSRYYKIVKSTERPKNWSKRYQFERGEFNDY
tara:strand:- start:1247 stop:1477 length:231 start_codon:yes stop_codon:yes gene_type:complete